MDTPALFCETIEATKAMQRLAGRMERAGMLRSAA